MNFRNLAGAFAIARPRLRQTLALVLGLVAMLGLGLGTAAAQPITATTAQDYANGITAANAGAPATQIVINSPSGLVISLGAIVLPTLNTGSTLEVGNGTIDSPFTGGSLTSNGTLTFNPPAAAADTIGTNITGTGQVRLNGSGTIVFTATNTYSGGTTITSGTLTLGDGAFNTGTFGHGPVTNNSALVFNEPTATALFGTPITGTGTVTQKGPGTVSFLDNGTNTYSGGTTIAAGSTLTLGDGSANFGTAGTGGIVNNGALILDNDQARTIANAISGTGTVAQLNVPIVTLSGANTYSGATTVTGNDLATTDSAHDLGVLELANAGALSPSTTITLQRGGGLATTYALNQTALNALSSTSNGFVALETSTGNALDFTNLPKVSLGTEGLTFTQVYSGTLTPTGPSAQSLSTTNAQYQVGGGNGFLLLTSNLGDLPSGVTTIPTELDAVNNGYTILGGFNTFSGGMNVSFGVVQLTDFTSYCALNTDCQAQLTAPKILVSETGILATGYALDQTTLNVINPASQGTVALATSSSNDLDFTLLPNVSLGAVSNAIYTGTITPGSNGYLLGGGGDFRVNALLTATQLLTGANPLTVNAPGFDPITVVLVNAETYTGNTTINGGTLQLGNGTTNGTIANTPLVTITNSPESQGLLAFNEGTPITFANPISGDGSVDQNGPGRVTLTQSETYTGYTLIYSGTLALNAGSSIATSNSVTIASNQNGTPAVLDISAGGSQTVQNLGSLWYYQGPVTSQVLLGGNTLTANTTINNVFDGVISGTGGLTKTGSATFTLAGNNTYSGLTTISAGVLELGGQAPNAPAASVGTLGTGPVTDNTTLLLTEPGAVTLPNAIGGSGTVIQNGPGTVTLSGTSTYSGGTTIASATTLALGAATPGTLGTGSVANSGSLLFTEPSAVILPNLISGTGSVTQAGPGTFTLTAVNSYAGGTTITAGTLALGGATVGGLGSGAVTDNATLAFTEPSAVVFGNSITGTGGVTQTGPGNVALSATNSYSGGTSIGTGATLILGASTIGTAGSGTVTDSGTLVFTEPSAVTVANLIGGSGGVQQSGPGAITLTNANSYTGTTLIVGGTLALGGGGSIAASSAVTVASTNGSGGFGVLDISGAGNQTINDLASAWLNQSGSAGASVLLGANTLTANATASTVFDGVISGTGGLIKTGAATLTLAGSNGYSGGTTISAGTLALGGQAGGAPAASLGTLGTGPVIDNAALLFTEPSAITVSNAISGTGSVTQAGPGIVTLNVANSYTGGTTINASTALALGAAALGTVGSGAVTDNGTLLLTEPSAVTLPNSITGAGGVTQTGPGTVTLSAVNSYSGGTGIGSGATLVLGAATIGSAGSGTIADGGTLAFAEPGAVSVGNLIGGSGGVQQNGPGTVSLTQPETYTGSTLILGGTLALGSGGSIATSRAVTIASTNASNGFGVLDISAGNQTVSNLSSTWFNSTGTAGASVVLGSKTLTANASTATTFDGVISGTGALTKTGAATMTLAGTNTFSGGTTISAGTLALGGQATGAPAATLGTMGTGAVIDNAALLFTEPAAITFSNPVSGTGTLTQAGPGTVTLNTTNSYTGGTTISAGTLALGGTALGTLGTGPVADNGTLAFTEPSAIGVTNVISGTGGVTQSGPGTITLNSASSYSGLTAVTAGTLIVGDTAGNGATVGGSVRVDAGATLAGYGSLGVAASGTTLTNNGTVIPGGVLATTPGTLTTAGNYVQGSGGNLLIVVNPSQASLLRAGGSATLAGTITFAYAPGTYAPATYTVLTTNGAITGRFGTVAENGAVPTALTRTVEYVPSTPDPVLLVLSAAPPVVTPGSTQVTPNSIVLAPANDAIFSEQLASLTVLADTAAATLLDGGTAARDCPMAGVPAVASESAPSGSAAAASASASMAALGRVICGKGGWIHLDGTFLGVSGSGGTPNYHANTAGFLAGIDAPAGDFGLRLGIAAGYDHRWLNDSAGASAEADVARFGLYAIQPVGRVLLNAAFLYGRDWDTTLRPTGLGVATAQYGGNEFSGGVRASLPMTVGGFNAVPMAGLRIASVGGNGFIESGTGALSGFGVSGAAATQSSIIPYARVVVSRDFTTVSGIRISPYAAVGYQYEAGDTEQPVLLTAVDRTTFNAESAALDRNAATLGAGIAAERGNLSFFATYGALIAANWQAQEVSVGLRVNF